MSETAFLLKSDGASLEDGNVTKVLDFFGVPWRAFSVAEFLCGNANGPGSGKAKLLCASGVFLKLVEALKSRQEGDQFWRDQVHSAFVYAENAPGLLQRLVESLTGTGTIILDRLTARNRELTVSDRMEEFCGVMSGLRMAVSGTGVGGSFVLNTSNERGDNLISAAGGSVFLRFDHNGVPVFLSTCNRMIDVGAELPTGIFDIRDHILSAAPIVLYVKWAFGKTCWHGAETNACLVIDDPVLKPTYGFVNFQQLLSMMNRHGFSTNIAFIPWNWRRSDREVVQLFRENQDRFSLSVHGCDHTRAEFGGGDQQHFYAKARQALERMARHEQRTGISYDPVMVFPQGVFSEAAMSALRHTSLIAAVNNDTISTDPQPRPVRICDAWDIAIRGYSGFPLFTRRYPWAGVENFAFDILLGKPCISIIHHDFCRDGGQQLEKFICQINALKCSLTWRRLGEVVGRGCRQRELSPDAMAVEMYGTQLRIENHATRPKRFCISRQEPDLSAIQAVSVDSRPLVWNSSEGRIHFEIELDTGQSAMVCVSYRVLDQNGQFRESLAYKTKTMLRRYLSEMRDNHVMKWRGWRSEGAEQDSREKGGIQDAQTSRPSAVSDL